MPPLTNVLLGILSGVYVFQSKVDGVFWPHAANGPTNLQSKIPFTSRQAGVDFYKVPGDNIDYFLGITVALCLVGMIGGAAKNRKTRVPHILAFIFTTALAIEILYARPTVKLIQRGTVRSKNKSLIHLYWISVYHLASLGCLLFSTMLEISAQETEQEYDDEEDDKQKKE